MKGSQTFLAVAAALALSGGCVQASAQSFSFSTNGPDGRMAMASNPGPGEREAADDFVLSHETKITSATFTGLVAGDVGSLSDAVVEIYRLFPKDSNTGRTIKVPTRINSPSDVAFASRDRSNSTFTVERKGFFATANSVLNGISASHPTTGGDGPVSGNTEVKLTLKFNTPLDLPADHYFFVPQVQLAEGQFYWLSARRPIVSPGTPFEPDLQAWIRNEALQPDWLRVGTDIVGGGLSAPTFNGVFSLSGAAVPEPNPLALVGCVALLSCAVIGRGWALKKVRGQ